jgi:hypothetical protein
MNGLEHILGITMESIRVAPAAARHFDDQFDEPGIRDVVRMAVAAGHIGVLNHEPPARADKMPHVGEDIFWFTEMRQQKPCVDEVEQPTVEDTRVTNMVLDARQLQDLQVEVNPSNPTLRTDDASYVQCDVAAATTEIEALIAAAQPCIVQ